jgi:hypothetical protein
MHEQKVTRAALILGFLFVLISQICEVKFVRVDLRLQSHLVYTKQSCNWPPVDESFQLFCFY